MRSKAVFILIAILIAAALFWVFNPAKSMDVDAVKPQRGKAVQAVYATGTVEASRMIPVSPKIAARLMELNADEGDKVEAGQILARLEDTDLQQNVTELEARRVLAQKDMERAQKLGRSGAISKEGLDTAQANFAAADASYERAKAEL
ncbi:MAG: efflux RND transporter periplasmic adaptor subunit, partial [Micavibrio aeruginosavorus]